MDILISDKKKIIKFAVVFNNLKNIYQETNFYFTKKGLYIQSIDASQICCCELNLSSNWFDNYKVKNNYTIGINLEILDTILSCLNRGFKINFKYNEKQDKFKILLLNEGDGNGITKMFDMVIINIDEQLMEIPKVDYSADITMKSSQYKDYITEISKFGVDLTIDCSEDSIILLTKGEMSDYRIILPQDTLEEFLMEENKNVLVSYNLNYVKFISNLVKVNPIMTFNVSNEFPMRMSYCLDEKDENNKIDFYIAPKIID